VGDAASARPRAPGTPAMLVGTWIMRQTPSSGPFRDLWRTSTPGMESKATIDGHAERGRLPGFWIAP
jgi:hypothetical protein